jgi:hypothetical protein
MRGIFFVQISHQFAPHCDVLSFLYNGRATGQTSVPSFDILRTIEVAEEKGAYKRSQLAISAFLTAFFPLLPQTESASLTSAKLT